MLKISVLTSPEEDWECWYNPSVYNSLSKQHSHVKGNENGFLDRVCMELYGVFCLYFKLWNGFVIWYAKL